MLPVPVLLAVAWPLAAHLCSRLVYSSKLTFLPFIYSAVNLSSGIAFKGTGLILGMFGLLELLLELETGGRIGVALPVPEPGVAAVPAPDDPLELEPVLGLFPKREPSPPKPEPPLPVEPELEPFAELLVELLPDPNMFPQLKPAEPDAEPELLLAAELELVLELWLPPNILPQPNPALPEAFDSFLES